MCYPKPGPRCSAHAKARYIKLRQELSKSRKRNMTWEETEAQREELEEAKLDFDSTPVGQARLKMRIQQGSDHNGETSERLAHVQELRRLQLLAVKSEDKGDIHNHEDTGVRVASTQLKNRRKPRKKLSENAEGRRQLQNYIDYSQNFAQHLSTEESNAIYWHTSDGSGAVNGLIYKKYGDKSGRWSHEEQLTNTGDPSSEYPQKDIIKQIKTLDGIFARHSLPEPVVLYRGIGKNNFPDGFRHLEHDDPKLKEYLDEKYPVGKEISIPEYMSTSLDPSVAHRFSGGIVNATILEVRTKKAIPVAMSSAWDADEAEFIVNRNGKYRVVSVQRNVTYENVYTKSPSMGTHNKNVTVIQLEEI